MATWHLLQISDVLDVELGAALAERVPLLAWEPERSIFAPLVPFKQASLRVVTDPPLEVRSFPVMRGYARFPLSLVARTGVAVSRHLLKHTDHPSDSPLICTTPYLAPVAERWPGPVLYWLTDRIERYQGVNPSNIHSLDRRMCAKATLVCPNSRRLAEYLIKSAACDPQKLHVLPNATRASNILDSPLYQPAVLPRPIADLPRPVAGIIGNLAGNTDWLFLEDVINHTRDMSWAFIGPSSMPIVDAQHSAARERVMRMRNARFVGRRPYGELAAYARSFDVAVIPYRLCEPTYSGSSTRFYEHMAACRPILATRGFEELLRQEPLLRLVDSAGEAVDVLAQWRSNGFEDGFTTRRWQVSQGATWQSRARTLQKELALKVSALNTSALAHESYQVVS